MHSNRFSLLRALALASLLKVYTRTRHIPDICRRHQHLGIWGGGLLEGLSKKIEQKWPPLHFQSCMSALCFLLVLQYARPTYGCSWSGVSSKAFLHPLLPIVLLTRLITLCTVSLSPFHPHQCTMFCLYSIRISQLNKLAGTYLQSPLMQHHLTYIDPTLFG